MFYCGIDPGSTCGGAAVLDGSELVWLAQWRRVGNRYRYAYGSPQLASAREADAQTLGEAIAACLGPHLGSLRLAAVEAVVRHGGRPAPIALATAAGVAVGLLEASGAQVRRPSPTQWRSVYFGAPITLERERAKRVALDWLHGRQTPAAPPLRCRSWDVPQGVSWADHAAEATAIAAWLQESDS